MSNAASASKSRTSSPGAASPLGGRSSGTFFPSGVAPPSRPRRQGMTHLLDRLSPLSEEGLAPLAPYIDVVKIGWGLPLLLPREVLRRRIQLYQRQGLEVSTGGTLLEYAVLHGRVDAAIAEAKELGFDLVEVSEGVIPLSMDQVAGLVEKVRARGLDVLVEVGKKDPHNQYSLKETLERVAHALKLAPRKVILESRESGRGVGIYDQEGVVKWDWVHALVSSHPAESLIFEAPLEPQQIALIMDLGPSVNLGNVALTSVAPLATQRAGLRGDTFGLAHRHGEVTGSPAAKFVHYLVETHRNLDQGEIVRLSRLPRRTVQSAVEELKRQGRLVERVSFADARKREYRLA